MSIPDTRAYFKAGIPVFTRVSEVERNPAWLEQSAGVWLDAFESEWYGMTDILSLLRAGKRVCVVSSELHGRLCIHADGETFVMRGTLKRLERVLDPAEFVRVHRSAIVNRHRITAMRAHRNGEYFLKLGNGAELKLSRKYKHNFPRLANRI
jgi:hypothetical protein